MSMPKIYGFNKTSESGVKVFAPSIFIQGCNFQCPFCFNAVLAKSKMKKKDIVPIEVVDRFIDKEKPEMIMLSGGEPFMLKNIVELVDHFIEKGLKIGISTHGVFPGRLRALLSKIDYVALDIKSSDPEVYSFLDLISDNNSFVKMLVSKQILEYRKQIDDNFDFEIRTTLYPEYVDEKVIERIGRTIKNNNRWVLQQYRPTKFLYDMSMTKGVEPYDYDKLQEILVIAKRYTKEAYLRYV